MVGFSYLSGACSTGGQVFVTDFNSDRSSDVLFYNPTTGAYSKMPNTGAGTFSTATGTWSAGLTIVASTTKVL
ncbi:MAG: hypothetical protein HYS05_15140 [Acidobacteria bacterium]|nr:hypothetical protein [Acidobacteriota bacterium]